MAFGKKERPTVDKDGAALVMRKRDYLADFSGQLGLGLMANLVGQLQYFYTDKVGIAVGSVGVVMVIAKVVDALTTSGSAISLTTPKGGNMKYYKWMLRMAVPAAVITVMMFTVPIQAGQIPAVAYALVTNLLVTAVIYTMIATPFAATMIVRTRSQQERGNMGIACGRQLCFRHGHFHRNDSHHEYAGRHTGGVDQVRRGHCTDRSAELAHLLRQRQQGYA
ncbi:MAG: MFS transporter [Subdoligranulum sp.]